MKQRGMELNQIKTVVVVGAGAMGRQIAMSIAMNGTANQYDVILCDSFSSTLESAQDWAREYLDGRERKGRITRQERVYAEGHLHFSNNIDASAARGDVVIEAVIEDLEVKRELFRQVNSVCKPEAILATNSSNMASSKFASVVTHPERLINLHFFNPALVMKLVEVVQGEHTAPQVAASAKDFVQSIGKHPVVIQKEIPGFVANRINAAVTREACKLLEKGVASIEEIDFVCEEGLGYPMGPFRLMDMTGIDVNYYVRTERYAESGDPLDAPSPLVVEKFNRGEFGRKTGKGWYTYVSRPS